MPSDKIVCLAEIQALKEMLRVIEFLASEGENTPTVDAIYRIVHSHLSGDCYDVHKDWRKEYRELVAELKGYGEI